MSIGLEVRPMDRIARALRLIAALAVLSGVGMSGAAAQGCLSTGEARSVVASQNLIPFAQLHGRVAAAAGGGQIVSAQLCGGGGSYFYRVQVLSRGGSVTSLTVDARSGAIRGR